MLYGTTRLPRNIVFGAGQRRAAPKFAAELGRRALIVTDPRLHTDTATAELVSGLQQAGVEARVFGDVVAELPVECLRAGVAAGEVFKADVVIGLGGGSCIDAAKIVALILAHGADVADYYGEFKVPGPTVPVIAIPTTSGTGSQGTPVAVVSDADRAVKVGVASPHLIPQVAICDPELTMSCPPSLSAVSGADALTHAIEAFTTKRRVWSGGLVHEHVFLGKNELSDMNALWAIRNIADSLVETVTDGSNREARQKMMFGALLAGMAFGTAGTSAAHAVQYPVGALTKTPHGAGVAVMLPYVMAFNRSTCLSEFNEVARVMGVWSADTPEAANAEAAIEAVANLFRKIGIPGSLKELGLDEKKIGWVAEQAMQAARLIKNNPRELSIESMTLLVTAAFNGDRSAL